MTSTFYYCKKFNSDLSKWKTERVISFHDTFHRSLMFNSDLSQWNISSATNTDGMFQKCEKFNQNLSAWNVERVVRISFLLCLLCLQLLFLFVFACC